jgi:hypothetical protein
MVDGRRGEREFVARVRSARNQRWRPQEQLDRNAQSFFDPQDFHACEKLQHWRYAHCGRQEGRHCISGQARDRGREDFTQYGFSQYR